MCYLFLFTLNMSISVSSLDGLLMLLTGAVAVGRVDVLIAIKMFKNKLLMTVKVLKPTLIAWSKSEVW